MFFPACLVRKKKKKKAESRLPSFGSCLELAYITPSFSFLSLSLRIFLILHTQTLNLENCMSSCNVVWNLLKSAMVRETCLSKNVCLWLLMDSSKIHHHTHSCYLEISQKDYCIMSRDLVAVKLRVRERLGWWIRGVWRDIKLKRRSLCCLRHRL
jgi:hypothetical protein